MNEDYPTQEDRKDFPEHEILQAIGSIGSQGALTEAQAREVDRHIVVEGMPFGD